MPELARFPNRARGPEQNQFYPVGQARHHRGIRPVVLELDEGNVRHIKSGEGLGNGVRTPHSDVRSEVIKVIPPAPVHITAVVRPPGAGTEPDIPVHFIFGRLGFRRQPVVTQPVAPANVGISGMNLAQPPGSGHFNSKDVIRLAEPLSAGLINPGTAPGGLHNHLTLSHGKTGRLLTIDILARPHRQDGSQCVPAVAGGNQNGIHIGPLGQELAQIGIHGTIFIALFTVHRVLGRFPPAFPDITDGDPLDITLGQHGTQIIGTTASDSDSAHHDAFAGRNGSITPERGGRNVVRQRQRACRHRPPFQEPAAREWGTIVIVRGVVPFSIESYGIH
ncbi:hypothetical protein SBV1_1010010 [Verrucomicrobia bacterium]|nr:hypothetical protein SBV1_1010010 [Verrucomicrobiota bacterium]